MARTNNLTNFLTDVSAAIKQKIGDNTPIPAANFDTEILSIETAGTYQDKTLSITTNGNYRLEPDQNYDAMSSVSITVSVPTGEDLDSVITTQEQKLTQLETILQSKASGGSKPNIFVQDTEPTIKDGIWLKMSNTEAEYYISDDNIFIGGTWALASETADIPFNAFRYGNAVTINSFLYLLKNTNNYKYDTMNNTYTKLTDIPYNMVSGSAVALGTDIYLFGGSESGTKRYAYKYDTLTDTYTQLTDIPYDFYGGSIDVVNTNIYLFGGGSNYNQCYEYNTLTNTYTHLTNIPYRFEAGNVKAIGTSIYLFGSSSGGSSNTYSKYNYKYDTLTDTYTQMANIPYNFYGGGIASLNTDIYLFGGDGGSQLTYKYNTLTNTYTQLTNIPYSFIYGSVTNMNTYIYLLGGVSSVTTNRRFNATSKTYSTDNSVVIAQGRTYSIGYNTKLFETPFDQDYQPLYGFADAYFYTIQDGLDGSMPVYYGDGTQWINIKNPPTEGGNE